MEFHVLPLSHASLVEHAVISNNGGQPCCTCSGMSSYRQLVQPMLLMQGLDQRNEPVWFLLG